MTPYSPTPSPTPDLRERRRRELARTIAVTAVDLFERNGFTATTIEDIASAAGISRTTFFRHCATKEAAVLVDDAGLESELIATAEQASDRPLHQLETAWETMTTVFDSDPEGHDRFLRVRRLMRDNPALLAAGLERDARLTEQISAALTNGPGLDSLDAYAVAESFALGMRLTFDEWVRRTDQDPSSPPPALNDVYQHVREALARANGNAPR